MTYPTTEADRKALYSTARASEVQRRVNTNPKPSKGRGEPHRGQERAIQELSWELQAQERQAKDHLEEMKRNFEKREFYVGFCL